MSSHFCQSCGKVCLSTDSFEGYCLACLQRHDEAKYRQISRQRSVAGSVAEHAPPVDGNAGSKELAARADSLRAQVKNLEKMLADGNAEIRSLEDRLANQDAGVRSLNETIESLHAKLGEKSGEIRRLESGRADLQVVERQTAALEEAKKDLAEEQRLLGIAARENRETLAGLKARSQALSRRETLLDAREQQVEEKIERRDELLRRIDDEWNDLQGKRKQLVSEREALRDRQRDVYEEERELSIENSRLEQEQDELGEREAELQPKERQLARREKQIGVEKAALSKREQALATRGSRLDKREQELRARESGQKKDFASRAARLDKRERDIDKREKKLRDGEKKLANVPKTRKVFQAEMERAARRLQRAKNQGARLKDRVSSLERLARIAGWAGGSLAAGELWPYRESVVVVGEGPYGRKEMTACLNGRQFYTAAPGNADASIMVVGRERWNEEDLERQLEAREGEELRVYSQEMFLLALALSRDPLDEFGFRELIELFAAGHPALQYLTQGRTKWPGVGSERLPDRPDTLGRGVEESPLHAMGYHVGYTSKLTETERREKLHNAFNGKVPAVGDKAYMAEWGRPKTARRLWRMAHHVAFLANSQGKAKRVAGSHWAQDLRWMKKELFRPWMNFKWPSTRVPGNRAITG